MNYVSIIGLCLGFTLIFGCQGETTFDPPNIILILADDLGYGDVETYNPESKIPTPHLNGLAREGIHFTNAHAPAAVCTPTRYSILTGRYPWRSRLKSGVLWIWDGPLIERERLTLGAMLQQKGYHTACIGKWHLGWVWPTLDGEAPTLQNEGGNVDYSREIEEGPITYGFDHYFGDDVPSFPPHAFIENDRLVVKPSVWHEGKPGAPGAMAPGWTYEALLPALTKRAVDYLEDRAEDPADSPFFLFFSLSAPHTPIAPDQPFLGKSGAGRYGDFVHQVDHSVGLLLQKLEELGISENTLVIFTSDNGSVPFDGENYVGTFGSIYQYGHRPNGDLRGVKSDIWEGGHRVPFIARWPGQIPGGTVSNRLISLTDLMATFAALAEFTLPEQSAEDSQDILPSLLGKHEADVGEDRVFQSGKGILALHQGPWKLIMSSGSGGSWSQPKGELPYRDTLEGKVIWRNVQLYHLEKDPGEAENLADLYPESVEEMANRLKEIILEDIQGGIPEDSAGMSVLWEQVAWIKQTGNH
jgi:arylsulfatase A-like enzyme